MNSHSVIFAHFKMVVLLHIAYIDVGNGRMVKDRRTQLSADAWTSAGWFGIRTTGVLGW